MTFTVPMWGSEVTNCKTEILIANMYLSLDRTKTQHGHQRASRPPPLAFIYEYFFVLALFSFLFSCIRLPCTLCRVLAWVCYAFVLSTFGIA